MCGKRKTAVRTERGTEDIGDSPSSKAFGANSVMNESVVQRAIESGDPLMAKEAFEHIERQFESTPDITEKARLRLGKATLHGVLGQFEDARRQLDLVLYLTPDDTDIRLQRDFIDGSLYDQEQKPEQAY